MHPSVKAARIAGVIYRSTLPLALYFWSYIPDKLIVRGNATATAENLLTHENLVRLWILGDLLGQLLFICLGFALYRLLRDVNRTWAFLMVGLVLVSAAIGFSNALNSIAAVTLFRGADFLSVVDKTQRDALAMFYVGLHSQRFFCKRDFLGPMAFSIWATRLPLRIPATLPRRLADRRLFRLAVYQRHVAVLPGLRKRGFSNSPTGRVRRNGGHALASNQGREDATSIAGAHHSGRVGLESVVSSSRQYHCA